MAESDFIGNVMYMQMNDCDDADSLSRLVFNSMSMTSSNDSEFFESSSITNVINEDVNLNTAYYDNQPMELGEGENKVNLLEWTTKPVVRWNTTDILTWVLAVAKENNIDAMADETNTMVAFSDLKDGGRLSQCSRDDFLRLTPNREFALLLYANLMKLKHNEDLSFASFQSLDHYTNSSQMVPLISVSSCYDSGDNASLYPLQEDFTGAGDSGYEDPSDSELMGMLNQHNAETVDYATLPVMPMSAFGLAAAAEEATSSSEAESEEETVVEEESAVVLTSEGGAKKRPGRPRGIRKKKPEKVGRLWEFIRDLLNDSRYCPSIICWEDYEKGTFRFVQSEKVAKLWGEKKENSEMNFEKFSRAMRYYYKSKVLIPVQRRLVYQFGPKAMIRQNQALQSSNPYKNSYLS
ncbi:ETS homologous factor-like isoform X1 [Nilaparvata lugens]|uniref:ETS homologous factor-like isoform X1 n=2 Tax=Nilaparvata lugens TaxID=108931 RepID=UPI00193DCDAF|nr:ETS homologous factor-like isoform X1 [Nilaparvata lugens]